MRLPEAVDIATRAALAGKCGALLTFDDLSDHINVSFDPRIGEG